MHLADGPEYPHTQTLNAELVSTIVALLFVRFAMFGYVGGVMACRSLDTICARDVSDFCKTTAGSMQ